MAEIDFPDKIKSLPKREDKLYKSKDRAYYLETKGADIYFANYPAGFYIDFHTHPTHNIGVVTEGKFTLIMDGKETVISVGEWYDIPAKKRHAARIEEDITFVEFWFKTDSK